MRHFLTLIIIICSFNLIANIDLEDLLSRMTNEDKCGQMTQVNHDFIELNPLPGPNEHLVDEQKLMYVLREKRIGSLLNVPYYIHNVSQRLIDVVQRAVLDNTDLKIPVIFAIDSIHGASLFNDSVLFPHGLAIASTFNVDVAYRVGEITGLETRATGIRWNFSPVLDIARQPLWPRMYEGYGEDPYLGSKIGEAYIRGHQGNDLKNDTKAAVCLKHYLGYGFPLNGKDRTDAYIPDITLRDIYLPPFEQGIKAGAITVMINSGHVNGIPGHANSYYITEILKGELKLPGFTVSDWRDIIRLHERDKIAKTPEDAVRIAVMAGVDMSMVPGDFSFYDHCVNISKKDREFAERITDASRRILKVKEAIGLFDNPFPNPDTIKLVGAQSSIDFNLDAAHETIILAKNENDFLPLTKNKKILVAGPTATSLSTLNSGWTYDWQGDNEGQIASLGRYKYTILDAIKKHATDVTYAQGANFTHLTNIQDVLNAAGTVDVILLTIGEPGYAETPGNIDDLMISQSQRTLANELIKLNKPIVIIYTGGRPRIITEIVDKAKAMLIGFYPGERGGEAIANVLFGDYNPNGRLPITYPKNHNGYTTYDYLPLEEFEGNTYETLFPFGHGLSYTTFTYTPIRLSTTELSALNSLNVQVDVTNTGKRDGKETVMLFLNDEYGSVPRPLRQLKKFEKISLQAGETKTVSFTLNMDDLSFINLKSKRVYEPGKFNIYISNQKASFVLKTS